MEKLLTEFVHYLRGNEIVVPTTALEEAVKLLPYMNVSNKNDFQTSLQQLFVKHAEEIERYDLCFQEFFFEKIKDMIHEIEKKEAKKELESLTNNLMEKQEKRLKKQQKQEEKERKESGRYEWQRFLEEVSFSDKSNTRNSENEENMKKIHEIAKNKGEKTKEQLDFLGEMKPKDLQQYIEELIWKAIQMAKTSFVFDSISQLEREMSLSRNDVLKFKQREETLLNLVEKKEHSGMRKMVQTTIDKLQERELNKLSKGELEELREYIRRHTKNLMTKFSKLLKKTHIEEELDMSKIIQNSARTYGIPMELFHVKPKKNRTKIDLILDVSGSVVKSAELLLMFMYLIYRSFPNQVRVFTFVGELTEVTEYMKTEDWEEMLVSCLQKAPIDYRGYSNYDKAFGMYEEKYMKDVTKNTILFILGDARNNRNDARVKTFQKLQQQTKAVYWFNPESKYEWNRGDSVIEKYQPYADGVLETVNCKQLLKNIEHVSNELVVNR